MQVMAILFPGQLASGPPAAIVEHVLGPVGGGEQESVDLLSMVMKRLTKSLRRQVFKKEMGKYRSVEIKRWIFAFVA